MLYETNALMHYDIKGQRWGVRRFQNEDGTYTQAGKERYFSTGDLGSKEKRYKDAKKNLKTIDKGTKEYNYAEAKAEYFKRDLDRSKTLDKVNKTKLSSYQKAMRKKYQNQGMSEEDAAVQAYKDAKHAKIMAAAAGIAVAAIGVGIAYRNWDKYGDRIIRTNTTLQRITNDEHGNFDRAFYAAYDSVDKRKYLGLYGGGQLQVINATQGNLGADVYKLETDAGDTMRVAGRKAAVDVLNDMLSKNSEMRHLFKKSIDDSNHATNVDLDSRNRTISKLADDSKFARLDEKDYDIFNSLLVYHDDLQQGITDAFYSALKKKGYSAVLDVNDKDYSGYNAKAPVIVFDSSKLKNPRKTAVDAQSAFQAYMDVTYEMHVKEQQKEFISGMTKNMMFHPYLVIGTIGVASGGITKKVRVAKAQKEAIAKYKDEHPNTKLSDREILESVYSEE